MSILTSIYNRLCQKTAYIMILIGKLRQDGFYQQIMYIQKDLLPKGAVVPNHTQDTMFEFSEMIKKKLNKK